VIATSLGQPQAARRDRHHARKVGRPFERRGVLRARERAHLPVAPRLPGNPFDDVEGVRAVTVAARKSRFHDVTVGASGLSAAAFVVDHVHEAKRAAARLGIMITHSAPGLTAVASLAQLNTLFTAWAETVYHARPHSETGQPPMDRWLAGAPYPTPSPARLREAFLWTEHRMVSGKTATVKLFGSTYEVDPLLAGRRVELVFDPFDLATIEVRWNGKPHGLARPLQIRRYGAVPRPAQGTRQWPPHRSAPHSGASRWRLAGMRARRPVTQQHRQLLDDLAKCRRGRLWA
jgi:hypothetical protein